VTRFFSWKREPAADGIEINLLCKVTSNGMKLRSNIRNSSDLLEKNVRYGYALINNRSRRILPWK